MTIASKLFFFERSRGDRTSWQPDVAEERRRDAPSHRRSSGELRRDVSSPALKSSTSLHRLQDSGLINNEASRRKDIFDERLPYSVRQARERLLFKLRSINLTQSRQSENNTQNQLTTSLSQPDIFTKKPENLSGVISGLKCKITESANDCSICLEKFLEEEDLTQLNCNHIFHSICLQKWVPLHSDCPYCRANIV